MVRGQARRRAGRGPADRLRGRLRHARRRRGGRGTPGRRRRLRAGRRRPFSGLRLKSLEPATRRRGGPHAGPVPRALGPPPAGFVVTLPKVDRGRAGRRRWSCCAAAGAAHGLARAGCASRCRSRRRRRSSAPTARATGGPDDPRPRPAGCTRPALRHLRLQRRARRRRRVPEPRAPGRRPRQGGHAGGGGRHRGPRSSDGSTNVLPVGDRAAVRAAWRPARPAGAPLAWNAASTRAGTCTRRSCRPGTGRRTRSSATGWPRPRSRLDAYLNRRDGGILDEPATARAHGPVPAAGLDCGALRTTSDGRPIEELEAL